MNIYEVAVKSPINNHVLTYQSLNDLSPGSMVEIPIGKRVIDGFILKRNDDFSTENLKYEIKEIISVKEHAPNFSGEHLELLKWVAKYYHYPLGKLLFEVSPKSLKRPRRPKTLESTYKKSEEFILNDEQLKVFNDLKKIIENKMHSINLLHGVTGSGKSVVALNIIKEVLKNNQGVFYILPEINLTSQFLKFFSDHLECPIYLYHSNLSNSEKLAAWNELGESSGKPFLVIGVRSSVFLPPTNLGMIILDEEHDVSFKQEDRLSYHAREIAKKITNYKDIPLLMMSATPSVESFYHAKVQKINYFKLSKRAFGKVPKAELIDITDSYDEEILPLTHESVKLIKENLKENHKILIYLNRLGYGHYLQCTSCGHRFDCVNCTKPLTYIKSLGKVICRICDYKTEYPSMCTNCNNMKIKGQVFGIEKVEEVLKLNFSEARVARFDRDTLKNMNDVQEVLDRFEQGEIDILIGTQMISKGHNLKNLNLVLYLGIDQLLGSSDFRALERAYQQLLQVTGRGGRFGENCRVIVQTMNPSDRVFEYVNSENTLFYEDELIMRKMLSLDPFGRSVILYLSCKDRNHLKNYFEHTTKKIEDIIKKLKLDIEVLGPRPIHTEKRVNLFTWSLWFKSTRPVELHQLIDIIKKNIVFPKEIKVKFDIDPQYIN